MLALFHSWSWALPPSDSSVIAQSFNVVAQKLHFPRYIFEEAWKSQTITICQFSPSGLDISSGEYKGILSGFHLDNDKREYAFVSSTKNVDLSTEAQSKYWPFSLEVGIKFPVVVVGAINNKTPNENILLLPNGLSEPLASFLKAENLNSKINLDNSLFSANVFVASAAWKEYLKNNEIGPNVAFALINDLQLESQGAVSYILFREVKWNEVQFAEYISYVEKNKILYERTLEAACAIYWFSKSDLDNKRSELMVTSLLKYPQSKALTDSRPELLWISNIIKNLN